MTSKPDAKTKAAHWELAQLVADLARSEWLPPEELAALLSQRLAALLAHHARHTPAFAARLKREGLKPADIDTVATLSRLPVLARQEVQSLGANFYSRQLPPAHRPVGTVTTSGSTGQPITVRKSAQTRLYWGANTARDHRWFRRDVTGRLLAIRANFSQRVDNPSWGYPMAVLGPTGPSVGLPVSMNLSEHLRIIDEFQPQVVLTFPNVLAGLIAEWERRGDVPRGLRHLKAIGETVQQAVRDDARRVCGLPIEDLYSSQEGGLLALQCPDSGLYHTMAESAIVEVLDDAGAPSAPGEMGQLVITDLCNFASPIIRYRIGDIAVASAPCRCGRSLPTLQRVMGRERNLLVRPDGGRRWPLIGFSDFHKVAPVLQFRFIQHSLHDIELIVHTAAALSAAQQQGLGTIARKALEWPEDVRVTRVAEALPRSSAGKFEDFISKVTA